VAEGSGLAVRAGVGDMAATVGTLVRGTSDGVAPAIAPVGEEHAVSPASANAAAASHAPKRSLILPFPKLSRWF
jgi:hypothetical protein